MTQQQFKPAPEDQAVEVQLDGKTHHGQYHLEHDNIVVSYQGASKMVPQGADNAALARTILTGLVNAKRRSG